MDDKHGELKNAGGDVSRLVSRSGAIPQPGLELAGVRNRWMNLTWIGKALNMGASSFAGESVAYLSLQGSVDKIKPVETVYIETTIPSLYFDERTDAKTVARREWTRNWWDNHRQNYRLFTGAPTIEELSRGDHLRKNEKLQLIKGLEVLRVTDAVIEAVEVYVERYVMPRDPSGDAAHLALASFYKCDYLLTWNCAHLANANKLGHIRQVNRVLGLHVPQLVTPLELIGEDYEN